MDPTATFPGSPPASGDVLSEERLRLAVEAAALGTWDLDLASGAVHQSPRQLEILGLPPGSEVSHVQGWRELLHPDDLARLRDQFLAAAESGGRFEAETRVLRADGSTRWVAVRGSIIRDTSGRPVRAIGILADATERHRAEQALRESEARYRDLFENANDIIYTLDLAGRITSVNRRAEETFGFSREECLGRDASEMVPPEHHPRMREAMRRKLEGDTAPTVYELEILNKSGARIPVEINSRLILEGGKPVGIQGIARDIGERKRSEQALRQSDERFRLALEGGAVTVFEQDAELRYTWVYPQDPGFPHQNIGKTDADLLPNEEGRALTALKRAVLASGRGTRAEIRATIPGGVRYYDLLVEPRRDDTGAVIGVGGAAFDVTERRRSAEALRDSEERFRQLADNLPAGFIYQVVQAPDGQRRFSYLSGGVEGVCGIALAEALADPLALYRQVLPEDQALVQSREEEAAREGKPFDCQFRLRSRSGEVRWLHCRSAPRTLDDDGAIWDGIALDITARKLAEDALRDSEERLRLLANSIPQLAWTAQPDGHINWYNHRWYEYTGTTYEQMAGWGWQSVHDPQALPGVLKLWRASLATGTAFEMVFPLRGADGKFRQFLTRVVPLLGSDGRVSQWFGTNTDVSAIKEMEDALREADRRKDEFLAMLAHELRNPLAPIRNAVQIFKLIGVADATVNAARDMIERQVTHMSRLVDDLLDVSRITRGKILLRKQRLDLVPLVRAVAEDHRALLSNTGLTLTVEVPPGPAWVEGDPTRLSQVVGNLLHNANKFTDAGGAVAVRMEVDGGVARLVIRDTGIGMEEAMLARLFEPFSQADRSLARSRGGLGLGLALVKGLVELHGGGVRASSAGVGKGSEIAMQIPLCEAPNQRVAGVRGGPGGGKALRVLLIEDNRDAAESLRLLLTLSGHEVAVAHTGQAGLERAREFRPDLVLCDIGLPGSLDGYAVARALRADPELFGVTAVALSGYGQEEDQRKARQAGFDHHLTKPAPPEELQRLLGDRGR